MTDDERRAIAESVAGKAIESMTRERSIDPSRLGEAIGRAVREALPELDTTRPAITFAEAQKQALALIARRVNGDERAIPLPFDDLDAQFGGGLWPGLHFVTSTTGTGKTALALQIARGAANAGSHVLYVPLELDAPQLAIRMIADTLWDEWRANHKTWETNGKRGHEPPRPPSWSDAYEGRMSGDSPPLGWPSSTTAAPAGRVAGSGSSAASSAGLSAVSPTVASAWPALSTATSTKMPVSDVG